MLRIVILSCMLAAVCGNTYGGYGSKGGYSGGMGYASKGGYYSGYGVKGGYYSGYGDKGGSYKGYGKGATQTSQTIIPFSNPELPDFTLQGRDEDSPYGTGIGLIAAFGAFAILFALTRN
ncbi:heterogeneous nuclear ribonucleoprotein A3-like [Argopecten irradians]|uniref:heterogeneous nuclear ribonucleoprotein A3-like n=1 Tax=Argopecten irradians TaxID=31199 RepID=UPI0037155F30